MRITKARLKEIIKEEVQNFKEARGYGNETEAGDAKLKEGLHDEGLREMISNFISSEISTWHGEAKAELQEYIKANGFDVTQEVLQALSVADKMTPYKQE